MSVRKGPPTYHRPVPSRIPVPPAGMGKTAIVPVFAANPFDPRFVNADAARTLTWLGQIVNAWWLLRCIMQRECPDTLKELESTDESQDFPPITQCPPVPGSPD